ncbi:MAG: acetyl-CoA hydrolase/transferase C-terminal domain-containing protein [Thermodesulfobacteriota bacterium]
MSRQRGACWTSPQQAMAALQVGQRVSLPLCCGLPQSLMEALVADRERLRGLELVSGLQVAYPFLDDALEGAFTLRTWQCAPPIRKHLATGRVKYIPMRQGDAVRVFGPQGPWPVEAVMLQVSPPDSQGNCSLGVSVGHSLPLALQARLVIAEVNERMPRLLGPCSLHVSQIDYLVGSDRDLLVFPAGEAPGPKEREIGRLAAELIPDGATIQVGLGAIPEAILDSLLHKQGLKFWAMGGDKMVDLAQSGALAQDQGPAVTVTETLGSSRVFDFLHQNPQCEGRDLTEVINPRTIAAIPCFCSILSALEIDLTGQVNAETIKGQQFSAVGGSFDFLLGASFSQGGVSIIAMPSTTPGDKISRIVSQLPAGSAVTTPRHSVHYVITEYGVANLWGRSLGERARALAAIAHPAFREDLQRQAAQLA